ncbi:hypothetical protein BH10ACI2_BH10ACI2_10260 [soil metagenome]
MKSCAACWKWVHWKKLNTTVIFKSIFLKHYIGKLTIPFERRIRYLSTTCFDERTMAEIVD